MPSKISQQTTDNPTAPTEEAIASAGEVTAPADEFIAPAGDAAAWQRAREHLEQAKAHIAGQIHAYPAPIPACDAQFNYLLEQRGKIADELNRLAAAMRESLEQGEGGQAIAEFIASSEFIDEAAKRETRGG